MGRKPLNRERINITLPAGVADAMLKTAASQGRDRSDVIGELCVAWLRKHGVTLVARRAPQPRR